MTIAMAPPTARQPRAAWTQTAEYVDPSEATDEMLTIGELMSRTGLTAQAVYGAITHPRDHAAQRAPLRAIARPRWNVGGEPRWERSAPSSYLNVVTALRSTDAAWKHLPRITREDAVRAQLASLSGMGSRGPRVRKTNLDRWKKWEGERLTVADGAARPDVVKAGLERARHAIGSDWSNADDRKRDAATNALINGLTDMGVADPAAKARYLSTLARPLALGEVDALFPGEIEQIPFPDPVARIDYIGRSGQPELSPTLLFVWRETDYLREVLEIGLAELYGGKADMEWLATALAQPTVRDWVLEFNAAWVNKKQNDPTVDLDSWIAEP